MQNLTVTSDLVKQSDDTNNYHYNICLISKYTHIYILNYPISFLKTHCLLSSQKILKKSFTPKIFHCSLERRYLNGLKFSTEYWM